MLPPIPVVKSQVGSDRSSPSRRRGCNPRFMPSGGWRITRDVELLDQPTATTEFLAIDTETNGKSLMPEGITRFLTHGEQLDLIRFVSELGKPGRGS